MLGRAWVQFFLLVVGLGYSALPKLWGSAWGRAWVQTFFQGTFQKSTFPFMHFMDLWEVQ